MVKSPINFDIEEYIRLVQSFHGFAAPGVVVGGFMVHPARTGIPEGMFFNAICETPTCLPDAIQLLAPCTRGNGRLKIMNFGRFALSFFDKKKEMDIVSFLTLKD
jgi:formylmethanofuran dehydrogenase subunit E